MGGDAMFKALKRTTAKNSTLLVLLALASFADDDGLCYPSQRTLAKRAKVSRQTVVDAIRDLVAAGEVAVLTKGHVSKDSIKDRKRPGGFQATNYYQVKVVQPVDHLGGLIQTPKVVQFGGSTHLSLNYSLGTSQGKSRPPAGGPSADEYVKLLAKVAHDQLDQHPGLDIPSVVEDVKRWATRQGIPLEFDTVQKAVESALFQRQRRQEQFEHGTTDRPAGRVSSGKLK